jgi:hypothetical protein
MLLIVFGCNPNDIATPEEIVDSTKSVNPADSTSKDGQVIEDTEFKTIPLITSDDPIFFKKTVILFENDDWLLKTSFSNFISTYPFGYLKRYIPVKDRAIQDTISHDTLFFSNYAQYQSDSISIIGYHLEKACLLLYDKKTKAIVPEIKRTFYTNLERTICGKRYYVNRILFFETTGWVSK